mmetsp:Transcript_18684/g.22900  ORF Transcript_18684/g.22900 Transcript_18684/m.22900 type:complete len:321 (+) Transcript_18684:332-1294(+)
METTSSNIVLKKRRLEIMKSCSEEPRFVNETHELRIENLNNSTDDDDRTHKKVDRKDSVTHEDSNILERPQSVPDETAFSSSQSHTSCTSGDESCDESETKELTELFQFLEPKECPSDMSPDSYIRKLFQTLLKFEPVVQPTLALTQPPCQVNDEGSEQTSYIPQISEEELSNYAIDVVTATREDDLETLKSIHSTGRSLNCCNRFGESLLHMACRRGFTSIVLYLVEKADVSVRISDDCGRTPLHDALWHKECQYVIMDLLVRTEPWLLLTCDKRGHTPFDYARREHWANWRQFLWDRREHMVNAMDTKGMQMFNKKNR